MKYIIKEVEYKEIEKTEMNGHRENEKILYISIVPKKALTEEEMLVLCKDIKKREQGINKDHSGQPLLTGITIEIYSSVDNYEGNILSGKYYLEAEEMEYFVSYYDYDKIKRKARIYRYEILEEPTDIFCNEEILESILIEMSNSTMDILIQEELEYRDIYSIFLQIKKQNPKIQNIFLEIEIDGKILPSYWYCSEIEGILSQYIDLM